MAIKGKGRTKSRRSISAPPRPALVVRKPPIWRRRWVWALVGAVAVLGIVVGVLAAIHSHSVGQRKDREAAAGLAFVTNSRGTLPADREPVPPDVLVIFPSVSTDVAKVGVELTGSALET